MCEEVITEHSLKSLQGPGTYSVATATKFLTGSTRFYTGTKYHLILISNERATAYTNIHLFRCKHCDIIKFNQFLFIFARFLAIFSFDFENFRPS